MFSTMILILILAKFCSCMELKTCKDTPENQLCKVQESYDKTKVPQLPTNITPVTLDILEVAEVNVIERSMTVYLRLVVAWNDNNIDFNIPEPVPM